MKFLSPILVLFILLMVGCAGTGNTGYDPSHAEIVIIDGNPTPHTSSDVLVASVSTTVMATPAEATTPRESRPLDPWNERAGTVQHAYQILELEDDYTIALFLLAQANILIDTMRWKLENNTLPDTWQIEHTDFLISQADARIHEIVSMDDKWTAKEWQNRSHHRYCAVLRSLNTRGQEIHPR